MWKVTTEGDCEGKSTRDLGIHEGYLEDIAFSLAPKAMYSLTFRLIDTKGALPLPNRTEVSVQLIGPSGIFNVPLLMQMLKEADVKCEKGRYYESVRLYNSQSKEELLRNTALEKIAQAGLTEEERKAVGL